MKERTISLNRFVSIPFVIPGGRDFTGANRNLCFELRRTLYSLLEECPDAEISVRVSQNLRDSGYTIVVDGVTGGKDC